MIRGTANLSVITLTVEALTTSVKESAKTLDS